MSSLPSTATASTTVSASDDDTQEVTFAKRGCICFWTPCFYGSETTPSWWERMDSPEKNKKKKKKKEHWWARGYRNVREWSEIVAGPKWKTFIRRFNKRTVSPHYSKQVSFHYDPVSYSLNFDDAAEDGEDAYGYAGFSARFASVPASAKSSVDVGKDAPGFT